MGSVNSVQHQEAYKALRQKLKEVAQIVRLLDENSIAVSLEALSELPDLSLYPTVLNVLKDLSKASVSESTQNLSIRDNRLTEHFRQFDLDEEQMEQLVLLVQAWEEQKTTLVRIAEEGASHWEEDQELFWGIHNQPYVASTSIKRAWRLICEIENTPVTSMRRKLLLVSIYETVQTETDKLSGKVDRLRIIRQELNKVTRDLSRESQLQTEENTPKQRCIEGADNLRRQASLIEERDRLNDELGQYPKSKHPRQRVIKKILKDILGRKEISKDNRKKEEQRFKDHLRYGGRYRRFHPLGILFFLGEALNRLFERTSWTDSGYDAMLSYWQHLSGIYDHCRHYTPVLERLKQKYWDPLSTSPTVQEVNTPGLISESPLSIRHSSTLPEDTHDPEIPQVPTATDSSFAVSTFNQNSTVDSLSNIPVPSQERQPNVPHPHPNDPTLSEEGQPSVTDLYLSNFNFGADGQPSITSNFNLSEGSYFGVTNPYISDFSFNEEGYFNDTNPYIRNFSFSGEGQPPDVSGFS